MAWANFVDKTEDINDPANYIQGSLQADMPDPFQLGDYWLQNHPNWLQVSDAWIPPAPVLTKSEKIEILQSEYLPQFLQLDTDAISAKVIDEDVDYFNSILSEKSALMDEYILKLGVIKNG